MKKYVLISCVFAGSMMLDFSSAKAVVYCTYIGVPKGCVARPGVRLNPAPGVTPGVGAGAPGVGVTPGVGAPGVGVSPGTPANRGGPVNHVGRM